jgi:hypothetical protein
MTSLTGWMLTKTDERPIESYAVRLAFLLIPAVYLPFAVAGGRAAGLAWLALLAFSSMILLVRPLPVIGLRFVLPFLVYLTYGLLTLIWTPDQYLGVQTLTQQAVVAVMYIVAWRAFDDPGLVHWVARVSAWWLIGGASLAVLSVVTSFDLPSPRPLSISLVAMFAVANMVERTRASAWVLGLLGMGSCVALGSRMAAFAFLLLLPFTPNLSVKRWMRLTLIVAMVPFIMWVSTTAPFQERFFHEQGGTLTDILTLSKNVDTAGRLDNWGTIRAACDEASITGLGMAASTPLTLAASEGAGSHPHNEFLRVYCDTGLIGSWLHWGGFYTLAGARAVGAWHRTQRLSGGIKRVPTATMMLLVGFLLFSLTDNVLLYTLHYMAPLAIVLGLSDRTASLYSIKSRFDARTHV